MKFPALSSTILAALTLNAIAKPAITPLPWVAPNGVASRADDTKRDTTARLITLEQFKDWLATTDANVTFTGKPIADIGAVDTVVTYCSNRVDNVCGGPCTTFVGSAVCLNAPNTNCLTATRNVGFCDHGGCGGSCNQFSSCGTRLDNNFCYAPGTSSILVGA